MSNRLAGKVAVVTGASKGIGAGIARGLAEADIARVVAFLASDDSAWVTGEVIRASAGRAKMSKLDSVGIVQRAGMA
jgi:3-oxoacyl-[acyl-carrier protein] reductase